MAQCTSVGTTAPSQYQPTTHYDFSVDWFSSHIPVWQQLLGHLRGTPGIRALEIGSFEGLSALWLMTHILTDATARLTCIDTFEGSDEHGTELKDGLELRFRYNLREHAERLVVRKGPSALVLRAMVVDPVYDMIYIDGDHHPAAVLTDAVLSWALLKRGGIMIFDDYEWGDAAQHWAPKVGINAFINAHCQELEILHIGLQVAVRKKLLVQPKHAFSQRQGGLRTLAPNPD